MNNGSAFLDNCRGDPGRPYSVQRTRTRLESMTKTVLILGASGKIGRQSAAAFARAGWCVRKHDRLRGNLNEDAQGAAVIVNGWNPPRYHDWENTTPAITRKVIAAAEASGATVIVPGNVYNF